MTVNVLLELVRQALGNGLKLSRAAVRIQQQKYRVRTGSMSNALFTHMNDNNQGIDWKNNSKGNIILQ